MPRLNEAMGIVLLAAGFVLALSLVSYYPQDPSWNTATGETPVHNLIGITGAYLADLMIQGFGLAAFLFPALFVALAWKWFFSEEIGTPWIRIAGVVVLVVCSASMLAMADWHIFNGAVPCGGLLGLLVSQATIRAFNLTGSVLITSTLLMLSLYLVSTFSMANLAKRGVLESAAFQSLRERWSEWREAMAESRDRRAEEKRALREARQAAKAEPEIEKPAFQRRVETRTLPADADDEIPIRTLDDLDLPQLGPEEVESEPAPVATHAVEEIEPEPAVVEYRPPPPSLAPPWETEPEPVRPPVASAVPAANRRVEYRLPPMSLLNESEGRQTHDPGELKEIAAKIKSKFEEFNVLGSVVQINPGPVVTTFEFKPEAGIKYSRITNLTEDLCLGLQAESILIERIPGKPTVGIEVPNSRREVIVLRQILESDEFRGAASKLTIPLGKDISGRIKVHSLESMPHLLIAGSTGSGKSVMLNTLIMSILYKATPDDVRMILVDPKRVEMGPYEDIPHLLTPVITDPRKATNALRNAVLEMERRLKLLASYGVRNIDQFNKKVRQLMAQPKSLFDDPVEEEQVRPLPYILIVIDELADLMMLERGGVEEAVTRLAQMARAVGIHLVLATQRPSVDVITGLIKANFPSRISFRVATRVDSRTILDVMGAEHLLGKGDMLFLPPGSSRLVRVHASYVTETETAEVTDFWKKQARPDYDQSYLIAPPGEEEEGEPDGLEDFNDPMYEDAVRVVLEVGKASTSTLQRRLRLGYGRAARILDMMYKEGIIGPPDGSRPRDVLKPPGWLKEVEDQLR